MTAADIQYWDGSDWVADVTKCADINKNGVGNEFNVTRSPDGGLFGGKYILIYTDGSLGGNIIMETSDSVTGPFTRDKECNIWGAPEKYKVSMDSYYDSPYIWTLWNYNAKSQASISGADELYISYHFGLHDNSDRSPSGSYFGSGTKEYEHPTIVRLFEIKAAEATE